MGLCGLRTAAAAKHLRAFLRSRRFHAFVPCSISVLAAHNSLAVAFRPGSYIQPEVQRNMSKFGTDATASHQQGICATEKGLECHHHLASLHRCGRAKPLAHLCFQPRCIAQQLGQVGRSGYISRVLLRLGFIRQATQDVQQRATCSEPQQHQCACAAMYAHANSARCVHGGERRTYRVKHPCSRGQAKGPRSGGTYVRAPRKAPFWHGSCA